MLVLVATLLLVPCASAGVSPAAALRSLNRWRTYVGLDPVLRIDAELSRGCRLHDRYEGLHGGPNHGEKPGAVRYSALGALAGESSDLAGSERAGTPFSYWGATLFHSLDLLQPRLQATWWDDSEGFACIGGGDRPGHIALDQVPADLPGSLIAYPDPPDGATGVPTTNAGIESPSPIELVPGNPEAIGWIPMLILDGPWLPATGESRFASVENVSVSEANLTRPSAGPVAIIQYTTTVPPAVAILPYRPLQPRTWYRANISGSVEVVTYEGDSETPSSYPFNVSWRFKTDQSGVLSGTAVPWCRKKQHPASDLRLTVGQNCPRF